MRETERNAPFGESVRNLCVPLALHIPYLPRSLSRSSVPYAKCMFWAVATTGGSSSSRSANASELPIEAPKKLPRWLKVVDSYQLTLLSIRFGSLQSRSSDMLKKLMLSAVACSMIFVLNSNDASARVKDCCNPCQVVKVHKVRCPKPKCVRHHHHACCPAPASCTSGCGQVSGAQHLAPVVDHGPMPSTAAPVEAAPSPSAADAAK